MNRFSIYDSEEMSTLELIEEIGKKYYELETINPLVEINEARRGEKTLGEKLDKIEEKILTPSNPLNYGYTKLELNNEEVINSEVAIRCDGKNNTPSEDESAYTTIIVKNDKINQTDNSNGSKVDALGVRLFFGGEGCKGGRHAIQGNLLLTEPTDIENPDRNYVGVQGQFIANTHDNGTNEQAKGSGFGISGHAQLKDGVKNFHNITGCELNTILGEDSSVYIHNGLQIASYKKTDGIGMDSGISVSMLGNDSNPFRFGLSFNSMNGGAPLGEGSTAIHIDGNKAISKGVEIKMPCTGAYFDTPTLVMNENTILNHSRNNANLTLGSIIPGESSTPFIEFKSGGGEMSSRILAQGGGNGTLSGDMILQSSNIGIDCTNVVPTVNNKTYIGNNGQAFAGVYAYGTLTPSDSKLKENVTDVDISTALEIIKNLNLKTYNYKDNVENKNIGLIAQQVEDVLKDKDISNTIVKKEELLSLDYTQILLLLIPIIQEIINKLNM